MSGRLKKSVKNYLKKRNYVKVSDQELTVLATLRKNAKDAKKAREKAADEDRQWRELSAAVAEATGDKVPEDAVETLVEERERKQQLEQSRENLARLKADAKGFDRDHIWAFNSGNTGTEFRGNPKYLFAYISNYRPDIFAYWICPEEDVITMVRSLGFRAVLSDSPEARYLNDKTGVCVSEQVKGNIPFRNVKYLNVWHAMGYKRCERSRTADDDDLKFNLCNKYIKNNEIVLNQMIMAVTCEQQEEQFLTDFRVDRDQMLRIGYARCTYQKKYKPIQTFDHEKILKNDALPADVKTAVYAPTFRYQQGNGFLTAMKDLDALYKKCEENHIRLIFKMHPLMENESGFHFTKEMYADKPYFLFWDNKNDFYEVIMDCADLLIYDYSSIYSDFLIAGTKHYIRYIYDIDEIIEQGSLENVDEYYERTSGTICTSFDALLDALDHFEDNYEPEELDRIYKLQWSYAGEDDFEKTIQFVMDYKIKQTVYPTLYSFDIFDTLISRKGLAPESIFYAVQERMLQEGGFPADLVRRYPEIRHNAEFSQRHFMKRTKEQRHSIKSEIVMHQIFEKIQDVYGITDAQRDQLEQWEIDEELDAVIPLPKQIAKAKELKQAGNDVILISDMYLPKDVITKMLKKADPFLAELPFYLSNEYGVLKTDQLLFFEVYRNAQPFYNYKEWIHFGDNENADYKQPRRMNIKPQRIKKVTFSDTEEEKVRSFSSYDGYKVAAMEARLREQHRFAKADFVIDFVAPVLVSYVDWAVRDAMSKGFETLIFVSRDGHPLKKIADALIEANGWKIKTKYIYASRRVWRIPSYINEIDEDFWANYGGNFNGINSKEKFLKALEIREEAVFEELFPGLDLDKIDFRDRSDGEPAKKILPIIKNSPKYREYLLGKAEQQRELVCGYLQQEVNPAEKTAFVEFYGRGYNQKCHNRLWNHVLGREDNVYYYYARSILPTEGRCVRYNMTTVSEDLFFMEAIFANMPYKSVEKYERAEDGTIVPVIEPIPYDKILYEAMDELLPVYASAYAALGIADYTGMDHAQFDFCVSYYQNHKETKLIYENIGSLVDAISMYADKVEFAPPYRMQQLEDFKEKVPRKRGTHSIAISYYRSSWAFQQKYDILYQRYGVENRDPEGGTVLNKVEVKKNQDAEKKYEDIGQKAQKLSDLYRDACLENEVEDQVLFVLKKEEAKNTAYYSLAKLLDENSDLKVQYLYTSKAKPAIIAEQCAKSRILIFGENQPELGQMNIRPQTTTIMLAQYPIRHLYRGRNYEHKLYWQKKLQELKFSQQVDWIEVPADIQAETLITERDLPKSAVTKLNGSCITDIFFDPSFREAAIARVYELCPAAAGKKLIAMIPDIRLKPEDQWMEIPDIEDLQALLGEEYYILLDPKKEKDLKKRMGNVLEVEGFCRLKPKELDARTLLAAADIIVGDTRDVFFEAALLHKPTFSLATDPDEIMRRANICWKFPEFNPYPVVEDAEDLAEGILHADSYDYAPLQAFAGTYLQYCDGHSSERLLEFLRSILNKEA